MVIKQQFFSIIFSSDRLVQKQTQPEALTVKLVYYRNSKAKGMVNDTTTAHCKCDVHVHVITTFSGTCS